MISFVWIRFCIAVSKICHLSGMFCRVVVVGFQSSTFFGYFVMTHYMTCQTKMPLSRDGCDPREGGKQFLVGHVMAT